MSAATAVRAAAAALRDAEAMLAKTAEKLAAASASQPALPDIEGLTLKVEDTSAAVALGLADEAELSAAVRALNEATTLAAAGRSARVSAKALAEGLRRRLEAAELDLVAARTALDDAQKAWLHAEMLSAEAAYMAAAEIVVQALCRHSAGARSLESRGERLNHRVGLAAALVLPTINEASCARYLESRPHPAAAIGADLSGVLALHVPDTLESELAALLTQPTGLVAALKRAVRA